jgi:ATP-dependent Clp protease adaptor protein ClpS
MDIVAKAGDSVKSFLPLIRMMIFSAHKGQTKENEQFDTDVLEELDKMFSLVVWNDEVNTFEWVIKTLVDVCGHSEEQAEQCAMIIHTQGKYAVKHGRYEELKPQCDAITERGIGATVEMSAGQ